MTDDYKLFQTAPSTGEIKERELYTDENWSIYGRPTSWSPSDIESYFVHRCSKFNDQSWVTHHYWINYDRKGSALYDIDCRECHTSAPLGLQALWRFHNFGSETTLVFIEKGD